jgi:hypothetical protein
MGVALKEYLDIIGKTFQIYVKQGNDKQYSEGAVIIFPKSGVQRISHPL